MKLTAPALGLLAALTCATGCVAQEEYDDVVAKNKVLNWRVEIAERASQKAEAERRLSLRETDLAREDTRVLRERLALANDALRDAKKDVDEELKARLAELQAKSPSKQELSPYGGVVLESGILFASGRHELTKQGETALAPLVESLTSPKYDGFQVELSGHTDSDPLRATAKVYMDNHDLAAKRANSVRRFLIARGVPANRIYLSAWGETRPLGAESSAEGKAANRRVEIRLHHESPSGEPHVAAKADSVTKPASAAKDGAAAPAAAAPAEAKPASPPADSTVPAPKDEPDDE
ncbi:OmpA family protein [bacterium]|nr:OmpA family protein [bacterium]